MAKYMIKEILSVNEIYPLIKPEIYKHFKGGYYATMGLSRLKSLEEISEYEVEGVKPEYINARHTETDKIIKIWKLGDNYFHDKEMYEDKYLVLYKSLYDDTGVYAREYNMFVSSVDKEKYPDVKQIHRFEVVK